VQRVKACVGGGGVRRERECEIHPWRREDHGGWQR
jgi:hypothetical protein